MSVEMLVGVLIAWAAGKASRVGGRLDQLTDEALDHGVERVRDLVLARLGADTAVRRLLEEARETEGEVSNRTRHEAAKAIEDAAARDDVLAAALREASGARPMREPWKEAQVNKGVQGIYASGSGNVNIKNRVVDKVVNQYHRNPLATIAVGVVIIAVLLFGGITFLNAVRDHPAGSAGDGQPVEVVDSSTIVGTWTASDGTGTKQFTGNGGSCTGFYYGPDGPLDIGGPMTCSISSKPDAQGRYTLNVVQSMNRAVYGLVFTDTDHGVVFDTDGATLYEIERF
ncbi:MAG TPA: hypothetical protein VK083_02925 [Nocardia sp.]|uniref:hypothetical protein n=1 Tax=Nocardia TaxID=1817 RepID=UPI00245721D5|nr:MULTISPECIES: hypothetical protein [Nocardia]HLS75731.1 hypothetical protein [Nocardia sp.]